MSEDVMVNYGAFSFDNSFHGRRYLEELYTIGLSAEYLALATSISCQTIVKDAKAVWCVHRDAGHPTKKEEATTFQKAIQRFAELSAKSQLSEDQKKVRAILSRWLGMDDFLLGMEMTMGNLVVPECGKECVPYLALVFDIVGETAQPPSSKQLWTRYLREIACGSCATPTSREHLRRDLVARFTRAERDHIRPVWPDDAAEQIERMLAISLSQRNGGIIRALYGIGGRPRRSMQKVAKQERVSKEAIRQTREKALDLLRRKHRTTLRRLMRLAPETPKMTEILLLPVEEIITTERARNCLRYADIRLVGELVQYSEKELLRIRSFGETSLQQIQSTLREYGLHLGMEFDEGVKAVVQKAREAL